MPKYFPLVRTKTEVVEVPIGDGDRDVSYVESFDISEALAGTLGPVQTQDTLGISASPVLSDLYQTDSIDQSDELEPIIGPFIGETIDISEALAGTLGPVQTQDSIDATDDPVVDSLTVQEGFDASDAPGMPDVAATAPDSIDITDQLGQITQFRDDSGVAWDDFAPVNLIVAESIDQSDEFAPITGLVYGEMADVSVVANADIATDITDSLDMPDDLQAMRPQADDSVDIFDALVDSTLSATEYGQAVVSQSNIDNPNNCLENNAGTFAESFVRDAGGLGAGSQDETFDLVVSAGDPNFTSLLDDITSVVLNWEWSYETNNTAGNAGYNFTIEYSLNDGSSWATAFTRTATTGGLGGETIPATTETLDITATVGDNQTLLQQLRWRVRGTNTSGSGVLGLLVSNSYIRFHRFWVAFAAQQT